MGVIIPVGYSQATFKFALTGKQDRMVCTLGFKQGTGTPPATSASDDANTMCVCWAATGRPLDSGQTLGGFTFIGVDVTEMRDSGPVIGTMDINEAGTGGITSLPPNCAYLVKKNTALGGRKHRGRMFFPPLWASEGTVDQLGYVPSAGVTSINALLTAAFTAMASSSRPAYLLHSDAATPPHADHVPVPQPADRDDWWPDPLTSHERGARSAPPFGCLEVVLLAL